jgi:vang-like
MKSIKSKKASAASLSARLNQSANERFYEEYENERKLRKRRAKLVISTEEAFTHIKRIQNAEQQMDDEQLSQSESHNDTKKSSTSPLDPFEAAQAVFTTIARDLRRYLRATRQQPFFTRDSIVAHLANCISYDMSPKAFLQRYLNPQAVIFNERAMVNKEDVSSSANGEQKNRAGTISSHGINYSLNLKTPDQPWILICDNSLYQNIEDNLMIVLKQNEVSLMCTFKRLPRFNLIEDILDPKRNKFTLRLNSETTV